MEVGIVQPGAVMEMAQGGGGGQHHPHTQPFPRASVSPCCGGFLQEC